ncbi:MAG: N-acetylmuramoyl-L-alanine amidase [Planctomycetota bacterium]
MRLPSTLGLGLALASLLGTSLRADVHAVPNEQGALRGKTVVFSPGHGFLLDSGSWRYQRGVVHDLREDVHTNEIFSLYVQYYLANAGARVESVRERWFGEQEVIVDDADPGFRATGAWTSSSATAPFRGAGYRWAQVSRAATATAEFTPDIPQSGRYPVYVWFSVGANRATDATFVVHHSGGTSRVRLNQQQPGGHWTFLGLFHFERGTSGKVVLTNEGGDASKVVIADAVRFGGGVGASGAPRWRESAKAFLATKGFASASGDVTIRPIYGTWLAGGDTTQWRRDFVYVALHTNASGSTGGARGLSTFSYSNGRTAAWNSNGPAHYPTSPSPLTAESDRLRDLIHQEVLAAARADFEPSWPDRGRMLMNFGELREARNMPSALVELGFHDNVDDAALLADARFRAAAARAIYKAIVRYFDPNATIVPLPPAGLALENLGGGQVRVSWRATLDPLEPSAAPARYKVYRSRDGRGFDDGQVVTGTELVLSGLAAGEQVYVRVAALNDGGEGLATRVGAARAGDPSARALIVDGFTRAFRHAEDNVAGRYTYDYAVEHLDALAAAAPQAALDYAQHERVAAGDVVLAGYALVDWLLGREGSLDRTFDPTEQGVVERYLQGGGALLATGTELGWDLGARGGGQRFLEEVLGARYVADDGGARAARGLPGAPFAALPTLLLNDGRQGYDPATPDVLAPGQGAQALLAYEANGAPVAGVGRTAPTRTCLLGFPLESVRDPAQRRALASEAVAFLLPQGIAPAPGSTPVAGASAGGAGSTGSTAAGSTAAPGPSGPATAGTAVSAASAPAAGSGGGGGGGGGCSLAPATNPAAPLGALLLPLALLGLRRREQRGALAIA